MKLSVVIPVYNEAQIVGSFIEAVHKKIPDAEIIVVNDGSDDNTADVAARSGAKVISHPYNIGNGAAVKTGIRNAVGDKILLMDGDGQHNPDDIPALLEASNNYDMAVGARSPESHANLLRRFANFIYNILATYITGIRVKDLTSGFRVINRMTATKYLYLLPNTFSYPTTITLAYLRSGRSVNYVPINAAKRIGKSKIKPLKDGSRFLIIMIKIATLYSPLSIFMPTSIIFFLLGLANYAYTYLSVHRFTNMSALFLVTSIIIFMMGLISEQITQTRYDRIENSG
jgi:glycosyltransferase involved in cell wall biosynthesis